MSVNATQSQLTGNLAGLTFTATAPTPIIPAQGLLDVLAALSLGCIFLVFFTVFSLQSASESFSPVLKVTCDQGQLNVGSLVQDVTALHGEKI